MGLGRRTTPRRTGNRGDWDVTSTSLPSAKPAPTKRPAKPRKPLPPMSGKTRARVPERRAITSQRTVCALNHIGGCSGEVQTHEIVRRSQMKEAAYMRDVCIGLCVVHHRWDLHRLFAERIGIRIPRTVYDADPKRAVQAAGMLRVRPNQSGVPYWWGEDEITRWHANVGDYPKL